MKKQAKLYRVKEAGGFFFPGNGKTYPERAIDPLTDWQPADIAAALATNLIEEVNGEEPAIIEEVLENGAN